MSKNGIESQNLDEVINNISDIMSNDNDNISETLIKKIIDDYLITIINNKTECQKFFNTLYSVIYPLKIRENSQNNKKEKKRNKKLFAIYPTIYSFNPKLTIFYIDYFLTILNQMITEKNKKHFSFFSLIFSDVIECFYNCKDDNININMKQKEKLYKKFYSFINEILAKNDGISQSFGCLLLTEFIEKCPLIKEQENIDVIFRDLSEYLEDKTFGCKYDLLNCILSLILKVEKLFKPYANLCLFRILDFLTDFDPIKRKLSINIVYTLALFCKEEIIVVKENIIEFLNILKEDNVPEIREVCLETLNIIENSNIQDINNKNGDINGTNNIKTVNSKIYNSNKSRFDMSDEKIFEFSDESNQEDSFAKGNYSTKKTKNNKNKIAIINSNNSNSIKKIKKINSYEECNKLNKGKSKKKIFNNNGNKGNNEQIINKFIKDSTPNNSFKKKSKINMLSNSFKSYINFKDISKNSMNINIYNSPIKNNLKTSEMNSRLNKSTDLRTTNYLSKRNIKNKSQKKNKYKDTNDELYKKFQKEKMLYQEIQKQMKERKPKKVPLSSFVKNKKKIFIRTNDTSKNTKNKKKIDISTRNGEVIENSRKLPQSQSQDHIYHEKQYKESIDSLYSNNKFYKKIKINNNDIEKNDIVDEKINMEPNINKLLEQINIIHEKQNNIFDLINKLKNKINTNYMILNKRITKIENYINNNNDTNAYDNSNSDYKDNKSKEDDYYLYKLLPLISSDNISKLDISTIEDIIMKLCLKSYNNKYDHNNSLIMISFFNQIIRTKINLKANVKKNMKDALNLLKIENNLKLSQNDMFTIDNIIRAI